jgi:hypothetical protein
LALNVCFVDIFLLKSRFFESKVSGTDRANIHHQYIAQNIGVLISGLKEFTQKYDANYSNYDGYDYLGLA